jgi:hypothetical protein
MFLYTQHDTLSLNLEERSGFNFGWNFEFVKSLIPPEATRVSGTTVVISPAYIRHVTHFAESSIPIWHALSRPEKYPVHSNADRIFLKQVNFADDLQWNQKILSFLTSRYTKNATIVDASSYVSSTLVCFEEAALVGMGLHEFGYFANSVEAMSFRRQIILHYNVPFTEESSLRTQSRCLVLQRTTSRRLDNRDAVVKSIEDTGVFDCTQWSQFLHGELETMSFATQLSILASTQFLVAVHGSGLVNSIFLSTDSVVVDLLPDNYLELEWHNFASKAGVRFYFLFLQDSHLCKNECTGNMLSTSLVKCRSVLSCSHTLVDFTLLQVIALQSDFHIRVSPNIIHMTDNITYSAGAARNDVPLFLPAFLSLPIQL